MPIQQVKTIQGVKGLLNLSGSVPTGNPVGTLLTTYKKIQPRNYLYCDGRDTTGTEEELRTHYPALYLYLGSNVLPDYRECVMVGAEQNTTDNIATHDVYAQGEFKDDQMQSHKHKASAGFYYAYGTTDGLLASGNSYGMNYHTEVVSNQYTGRTGTPDVTHGKQKAVYVYIKAVDGVDISDEDSFLTVVENYIDEKNSYSETETLTGGTWIDGKPIYRKVFTGLNFGGTTNAYVNTGAVVPNGDTLINAYAIKDKRIVIKFLGFYMLNDNNITYWTDIAWNGCDTLVAEYTKTS